MLGPYMAKVSFPPQIIHAPQLWIRATDEVTQGIYLFTDGDQLTFSPPWAKKQEPQGDNWQRSKTSGRK